MGHLRRPLHVAGADDVHCCGLLRVDDTGLRYLRLNLVDVLSWLRRVVYLDLWLLTQDHLLLLDAALGYQLVDVIEAGLRMLANDLLLARWPVRLLRLQLHRMLKLVRKVGDLHHLLLLLLLHRIALAVLLAQLVRGFHGAAAVVHAAHLGRSVGALTRRHGVAANLIGHHGSLIGLVNLIELLVVAVNVLLLLVLYRS